MLFNEIRGHDRAVTFLKNSIAGGRIAGAYIFCGKSGIGKKATAIAFAKAVNCLNAPGEGCGSCQSCVKIDHNNHPDIRVIAPEKEGAAVKIDDIRSVIKDNALKPYGSKKKVYIVDEAGSLTEEASGALLKTLEEPSGAATLILVAENVLRLLPTIRSRCQIVKFLPVAASVIEEILAAKKEADKTRAHILARISCGSVRTAIRLSGEDYFEKRERIIGSLSSGRFLDMDFDKASKADLRSVLDIMLTWYRDIMVTKAAGCGIINIDKEDLIAGQAKKCGLDRLDNILKKIVSTQGYLESNANPKLAMMALGVSI